MREDLLASFHAVLLAPVLEELCFRQMAISPFHRRSSQIFVCILVAVLFGSLHVRNFPGAFLGALFYGMVFIWSRNIWYSVLIHAGRNLTVTLVAVYSWFGLGEIQMAKIPVLFLLDIKIIIISIVLALAGIVLIKMRR
jgi:membrane protease YdiL (CAAX protease family)